MSADVEQCESCGTDRPIAELQPSRDVFWRERLGKFVCRDRDACFDAFAQKPIPPEIYQ